MPNTAQSFGVLPDGLPDDYIKPSDAKKDPSCLRILGSVWGITEYILHRKKNGAMASGAVIEISPSGRSQRISPIRAQAHLIERSRAGVA